MSLCAESEKSWLVLLPSKKAIYFPISKNLLLLLVDYFQRPKKRNSNKCVLTEPYIQPERCHKYPKITSLFCCKSICLT